MLRLRLRRNVRVPRVARKAGLPRSRKRFSTPLEESARPHKRVRRANTPPALTAVDEKDEAPDAMDGTEEEEEEESEYDEEAARADTADASDSESDVAKDRNKEGRSTRHLRSHGASLPLSTNSAAPSVVPVPSSLQTSSPPPREPSRAERPRPGGIADHKVADDVIDDADLEQEPCPICTGSPSAFAPPGIEADADLTGGCAKCAQYAEKKYRERVYRLHVDNKDEKKDPFADDDEDDADKATVNDLLVRWLRALLRARRLSGRDVHALVLEGGRLRTTRHLLREGVLAARVTVPNPFLFRLIGRWLHRDAAIAELDDVRLKAALVYETLAQRRQGRRWQLVHLDYCCTPGGNDHTHPLRDIHLLLRRRLLDPAGALLGVTFCTRNDQLRLSIDDLCDWFGAVARHCGYDARVCARYPYGQMRFLLVHLKATSS